jgi:hypothetical protein
VGGFHCKLSFVLLLRDDLQTFSDEKALKLGTPIVKNTVMVLNTIIFFCSATFPPWLVIFEP